MTERHRPAWAVRLQAERQERDWSKREMARRLQRAAGHRHGSTESLARQIRGWEAGDHYPRDWTSAYAIAYSIPAHELFDTGPAAPPELSADDITSSLTDEALDMAGWLEQTNLGAGTISYLTDATRRLGLDYTRRPPLEVLDEAVTLQRRVTALLRGGRQRITQTQALLEISSQVFALVNLLAGDVGRYPLADAYGYAAWTCAEEADSDAARALVLCAQSKTARWEQHFRAAAQMARRGFEICPPGEPRVLLAVSEATALQSQGDIEGARRVLGLAQRAREGTEARREAAGAWSCPRARQATYALQVSLGDDDPASMLRDVQDADEAWADGDPWVYGTWAQIRIGAALAHLMTGDPEGAETELRPVFDLGPEYRVVTIIGRISEVGRRLTHRRYQGDSRAADLKERIRAFQTGSLEHKAIATPEGP